MTTMSARFCMVWLMRLDWRDAACHDTFDLRFFGTVTDQKVMRLKYCLECPLIKECRMMAVIHNEKAGLWGGHSIGRGA